MKCAKFQDQGISHSKVKRKRKLWKWTQRNGQFLVQLCTENQCNQGTLMAFYTNFATEFFVRFSQNIRFKRNFHTNDIFAYCSLIFYFLDFKFSNFVCPSKRHPLIWFFFKNSFRKKKNIRKTTQNALALYHVHNHKPIAEIPSIRTSQVRLENPLNSMN